MIMGLASYANQIVTVFNYEPLFKDHLLKPIHDTAIFNPAQILYWPSIVLFIALCLLVLLKATSPQKTFRVLNAAYSLQVARQIEREDYGPLKRVSIVLSAVFILITAFLFYKVNFLWGPPILKSNSGLFQYLFFVVVIILAYSVKLITANVIGFVTQTSGIFNEYINNTLIINQSVGVILLPVMIIVELSPVNPVWIVFPATLFLVLGYVLRLYRGFLFAGIEQGVGLLQLFVYLCTLEILPLMVLIKFLVVNF
jgi:preprotein translocase subunit SecG